MPDKPTDPVAEIKARALILLKEIAVFGEHGIIMAKNAGGTFGAKGKDGKSWSYAMLMTAFAAKEVERATAELCFDLSNKMCSLCDHPALYEPAALSNGQWRHKYKPGAGYATCVAAPIWERAHGKKLCE